MKNLVNIDAISCKRQEIDKKFLTRKMGKKIMAKQPTFDYFDKAIKILERSIFLWKKIVKGCRKFVVYNVNYFKLGMINLLFSVGMPYFV